MPLKLVYAYFTAIKKPVCDCIHELLNARLSQTNIWRIAMTHHKDKDPQHQQSQQHMQHQHGTNPQQGKQAKGQEHMTRQQDQQRHDQQSHNQKKEGFKRNK